MINDLINIIYEHNRVTINHKQNQAIRGHQVFIANFKKNMDR